MTILSQIWRRITSVFGGRARTTLHVRELEAQLVRERATIASQQNEIARLRAENRALLNSILGIAGIPPVLVEEPLPSSVLFPAKCHSESAAADDESRSTPSHPSSITAAEKNSPGAQSPRNDIPPNPSPESSSLRSSSPSSPRRQLPTPLRRRSWHQIMRTLELESGKKKTTSD